MSEHHQDRRYSGSIDVTIEPLCDGKGNFAYATKAEFVHPAAEEFHILSDTPDGPITTVLRRLREDH